MHLLLPPKEIVVFFSMRVTQFFLIASIKAENEFNQFLSRLFTAESLTQYVISYDDKFEHKHGAHVAIGALNATHDYLNISASSITDGAFCLNQFLRPHGIGFSWNDLELKTLPKLSMNGHTEKHCKSEFAIRHALNAVTVSYSMQWFDWPRWSRMIDWLALNGINAPLMPLGHLAVQRLMLRVFNMTDIDWTPGPAFLSWARMGNLQKWAGPPSDDWVTQQLALGIQVAQRMRSMDMEPVMPGFSGFVPDSFATLYPNTTIQHLSEWAGFNCSFSCIVWVDPTDAKFAELQRSYTTHQRMLFGFEPAYFAVDSFNEVNPQSDDPTFLAKTSRSIYESLPTDATWVMQGWLFNDYHFWKPAQIKAYLQGVPLGKVIVLDLFAEINPFFAKTDSFYGQPFVWCYLGNFGGNTGWYGGITDAEESLSMAMSITNTSIVGTGIVPEGLFQNEFVYDYVLQLGYEGIVKRDVEGFTDTWTRARYGQAYNTTNAAAVFTSLASSVWSYPAKGVEPNHDLQKTTVARRPSIKMKTGDMYSPQKQIDAWKYWMVNVFNDSAMYSDEHFRFDTVDITRAALTQIFDLGTADIVTSCREKGSLPDKCGIWNSKCASNQARLISDLYVTLNCDTHFMLGPEEEAAMAMSNGTEADRDLMRFNVRNQRTMWGPESEINDYAARHYAGLMQYYQNRWDFFFAYAVENGCGEDDFENYNHEIMVTVEQQFSNLDLYPPFRTNQTDDYANVITTVFNIYKDLI